MLALVPFICVVMASAACWNRAPVDSRDIRIAWICGSIGAIAFAVAITEFASLLHIIGPWSMQLIWVTTAIVAMGIAFRYTAGLRPFLFATLKALGSTPVALICLCAIFCLIAIAAYATPPNNYDSLTYHLPRVLYWHQQGSLENFSTANLRQLEFGPLNALLFLNLFELSGSDNSFNFLQGGLAALVLLPAASYLMEYLGASHAGRRIALVAIAGTPMFILQACSTQNDLLVATFLTASISLATHLIRQSDLLYSVPVGVAAGLAILTKGTTLIWGLPLAFWLIYQGRHWGLRRGIAVLAIIASIVLVVNLGYVTRNLRLSGTPFGKFAEANRQRLTLDGTASVLYKNLTAHLTTWDRSFTNRIESEVRTLHKKILLLDIDDPRTSFANLPFRIPTQWLKEDFAGNPLQLTLLLVTLAVGAATFLRKIFRKETMPPTVGFSVALVAGLIMFSALLNSQWWVSRLMTPWFVLCLIACAPTWQNFVGWPGGVVSACCILCVAAFPWLLTNETRPLWGSDSVFYRTRDQQWFSAWPDRGPSTLAARDELLRLRPESVGFHFSGDVPEYPILRALIVLPQTPFIRHVGVTNYSNQGSIRTRPVTHILSNLTDAPTLTIEEHTYKRIWSHSHFNLYHLDTTAYP